MTAKQQYRSAVSLSPRAYLRLKKLAKRRATSCAALMEKYIDADAEREGVDATDAEVERFKAERREKRTGEPGLRPKQALADAGWQRPADFEQAHKAMRKGF